VRESIRQLIDGDGFNPLELEGVTDLFWPDAAPHLVTLATGVSSLKSLVGTIDMTQASGGAQPSFGAIAGLNQRLGMTFNGSTGMLSAAAAAIRWDAGFYILAVIYPTAFGTITRAVIGSNSSTGGNTLVAGIGTGGTVNCSLIDSGGIFRTASTDPLSASTPNLMECRLYGTTLGARLNNGPESTAVIASPSTANRGFSIGSDGATRDFDGSLAFAVICRGAQNDPPSRPLLIDFIRDTFIPGLP
jgi:hypothetical protein